MIRRLLALLFVLIGFIVIAGSGLALFWSDELQRLYMPSLPSIERRSGTDSTNRSETEQGKPIGSIEIPRLGLSSVVLEGDDAAALLLGVGHLSDTPLPWHDGNTVLAAHRDTFFRPLAHIRKGDVIKVLDCRCRARVRREGVEGRGANCRRGPRADVGRHAHADYLLPIRLYRAGASTIHRQGRTAFEFAARTRGLSESAQKSVGMGRLLESQSFTDPSLAFTKPSRQPREPSRSGWQRALIVSPALM